MRGNSVTKNSHHGNESGFPRHQRAAGYAGSLSSGRERRAHDKRNQPRERQWRPSRSQNAHTAPGVDGDWPTRNAARFTSISRRSPCELSWNRGMKRAWWNRAQFEHSTRRNSVRRREETIRNQSRPGGATGTFGHYPPCRSLELFPPGHGTPNLERARR